MSWMTHSRVWLPFILQSGDPYEAEGDEYLFNVRVDNTPRDAVWVRPEYHDGSRPRRVFYVRQPQVGLCVA